MSAYICNDETFGDVLKTLVTLRFMEREEAERFVQRLITANFESVNYKYREKNQAPEFTEAFRAQLRNLGRTTGPEQLLKHLECINYQSCEPEDFFDSEIGKELEEMLTKIRRHIIRQLPAYENAAWGR